MTTVLQSKTWRKEDYYPPDFGEDFHGRGLDVLSLYEAARMCGVPAKVFARWDEHEQCPRPFELDHCRVWHADSLLAWIYSGMPDRRTWDRVERQLIRP